jgi:hypothetical protein
VALEELMKVGSHGRGARVPIHLSFAGDHRRGASSSSQVLDFTKEFLQLHAAVSPSKADAASPPRILALLRHGTEPVPNQNLVVEVAGYSLLAVTNANGHASFNSPADLQPGVYPVKIRFEGTRRYNPAKVTRQFTIVRHMVVSLRTEELSEDGLSITVKGQLKGDGAAHLGDISIVINKSEYALLGSDEEGSFQGRIDLARAAMLWGPREVEIRATYTARESFESDALSPALALHLPAPPSAPILVYLIPLLLLILLVTLGALWRASVIQQWVRWLAQLRTPKPTRSGTSSAGRRPLVERPPAAGPRVRSACFSAVIWDAHVERPLSAATVTITQEGGEKVLEQVTDETGYVCTPELAAGVYRWQIDAPGYMSESFLAKSPHAGHFLDCHIRMTPWRALALCAYEKRVRAQGQSQLHLGHQTPRELARMLAELPSSHAEHLALLTAQFEKLYFSGQRTGAKAAYNDFIVILDQALHAPITEERL